jgi:H2-forming N5,N10-methylenetetrahydromethanopterin dehydrogenase-like enzyme
MSYFRRTDRRVNIDKLERKIDTEAIVNDIQESTISTNDQRLDYIESILNTDTTEISILQEKVQKLELIIQQLLNIHIN